MSNETKLIDRYNAVMECLESPTPNYWAISQKYHVSYRSLKRYIKLYTEYGIHGLQQSSSKHYSDEYCASVMADCEQNNLSLSEASVKYLIPDNTLRRWQTKYPAYKAGDRFAFSGGRMYKCAGHISKDKSIMDKPLLVPESEERKERKIALSKLSKKELYELLLDREAELEMLKKGDTCKLPWHNVT